MILICYKVKKGQTLIKALQQWLPLINAKTVNSYYTHVYLTIYKTTQYNLIDLLAVNVWLGATGKIMKNAPEFLEIR